MQAPDPWHPEAANSTSPLVRRLSRIYKVYRRYRFFRAVVFLALAPFLLIFSMVH